MNSLGSVHTGGHHSAVKKEIHPLLAAWMALEQRSPTGDPWTAPVVPEV